MSPCAQLNISIMASTMARVGDLAADMHLTKIRNITIVDTFITAHYRNQRLA